MSSVEPTSTGPEPQSIVATNEKSAGSSGDWSWAEAEPANASESTAVQTAIKGRRMVESFRCASFPPTIGAGMSAPQGPWTHVGPRRYRFL